MDTRISLRPEQLVFFILLFLLSFCCDSFSLPMLYLGGGGDGAISYGAVIIKTLSLVKNKVIMHKQSKQ